MSRSTKYDQVLRSHCSAAFGSFIALALLVGCGDDSTGSGGSGGAASGGGGSSAGGAPSGGGGLGGDGGSTPFELTSSAFEQDDMIPLTHLCEDGGGDNISPALSWTAGPGGTQSYAVVLRDLDYLGGFLHWVIWDIPGEVTSLPEDVEHVFAPTDPAGAKQSQFQGILYGYFGPCSPDSVNTYQFTVYAIDVPTITGLDDTSSLSEAEQAIEDAAIATATLSGES